MPELTTLVTGRGLVESARWHDGRLWFADWFAHEIVAVDIDGDSDVVLRDPSVPLCFDWLPDGRLLVVAGKRLLRREPDGSVATHANLDDLSPFGWNDIAVDDPGNVYVDNVGFEFPGGEFAPGVLAVVRPDGAARRVAGGVAFPNGLAVTPDGASLIVAESYSRKLTAFDIDADGGLANQRLWADLGDGVPDGICVDAEGAVWYADVPNRRCARVREGGEVVETVELDRGCFSCTLGGAEGRTLFIVAARWGGTDDMAGMAGTGQVITAEVSVAAARRPRLPK